MTNRDLAIGKQVASRLKSLYKKRKATVLQIAKQRYRVSALKGVSKDNLISMILESEFGHGYFKKMKKWEKSQKKNRRQKRKG